MIPKGAPPGVWLSEAACKGINMELSSPSKPRGWYDRRLVDLERLMLCARCPVLDHCTDWVMSEELDPCPCHIVAGMVPTERGRVRKQMRKARQ